MLIIQLDLGRITASQSVYRLEGTVQGVAHQGIG